MGMAARNDRFRELQLQLPTTLSDRAEEMALRECQSLNLFVATAIAEKLHRLQMQATHDVPENTELVWPAARNGLRLIH